jgi:hypothetical protein
MVRSLWQILGDEGRQFAEAAVPCVDGEAGSNLWQNFLEGIASSLKKRKNTQRTSVTVLFLRTAARQLTELNFIIIVGR